MELMPVQEVNEQEPFRTNPHTGAPPRNHWGYNPSSFTAPNGLNSSAGTQAGQGLLLKHISKPTRTLYIPYSVFSMQKKHRSN